MRAHVFLARDAPGERMRRPKRELKWFTEREGGVEHVSADNMPAATGFIAD
jgi:hypothetical protein